MTPAELRAWRAHWRLSQAELADMLGVHVTTVNRWEREDQRYEIPPFLHLALAELGRRLSTELMERARGPQAQASKGAL